MSVVARRSTSGRTDDLKSKAKQNKGGKAYGEGKSREDSGRRGGGRR